MKYAIEVKNLTKKYGDLIALDKASLRVREGKIFGIIGPNGSGKTTLIKTLVGLLSSTSGEVRISGLDPIHDKGDLQQNVGYMPQESSLYEDLSAKGNVTFFAEASGVKDVKARVAEVLKLVELSGRADNKVYTFSGGMKKRISLACALVHSPKILFLDEPTAAIDPELKLKLWELFRKLTRDGVTLFISTHLTDEASYCDEIAILRKGKVLSVSSPDDFIRQGKAKIKIHSSGKIAEDEISSDPKSLAKYLKQKGLDQKIDSVEIKNESFDEILLSVIRKQK